MEQNVSKKCSDCNKWRREDNLHFEYSYIIFNYKFNSDFLY